MPGACAVEQQRLPTPHPRLALPRVAGSLFERNVARVRKATTVPDVIPLSCLLCVCWLSAPTPSLKPLWLSQQVVCLDHMAPRDRVKPTLFSCRATSWSRAVLGATEEGWPSFLLSCFWSGYCGCLSRSPSLLILPGCRGGQAGLLEASCGFHRCRQLSHHQKGSSTKGGTETRHPSSDTVEHGLWL